MINYGTNQKFTNYDDEIKKFTQMNYETTPRQERINVKSPEPMDTSNDEPVPTTLIYSSRPYSPIKPNTKPILTSQTFSEDKYTGKYISKKVNSQ